MKSHLRTFSLATNVIGRVAPLACMASIALYGVVHAAVSPTTITRVEEDWELVVSDPDQSSDAPQVTCVLSPVAAVDALHASLEINHQTQPDYRLGGVQLQVWNGESHLQTKTLESYSQMGSSGETVTWTQRLTLDDGVLTFRVVSGESTTWGSFGGKLSASVGSELADLSGYNPDVSAAHSGVAYASHRVTSIKLKEVRYYDGSSLVSTDNTERIVYQHE